MIIVWAAIVVFAILTVFVSFQVVDINAFDIFILIFFFYFSTCAVFEILKLPFGKLKIDNSKELAQYIFKDLNDSFWHPGIFSKESLVNIRVKGIHKVWVISSEA